MAAVECTHLIGGQAVGRPTIARLNPADPEDAVSLRPEGDPTQVHAALTAAVAAQVAWCKRDGGHYLAGVEFVQLRDEDKERIEAWAISAPPPTTAAMARKA